MMMTDNTIDDVDMMNGIMGGTHPAPGDEMVSSTSVISVPRSSTELAQNGNNSSNTNPYEPLVSPAGLASKARTLNDKEGAPKTDPSQRPGAYTARGRAFASYPAWHRSIMNAHLAASFGVFRQGSRRSITASGNDLPRSGSRRLSRVVDEEDNTEQISPLPSRFPRSSSAHKRKYNSE